MTIADVAAQFKTAMVAAAAAATAGLADPAHQLLVCYGHPGTQLPDDIVSVGRVTSAQEPEALGTNRSRWNVLTAEVTVSVFRAGGPEQEQIAGDRAYQLLVAIEERLRVTDTSLGGLVLWCFCTGHESNGSTDPDLLAKGRVIDVIATFTARARITS
jgi:hypothetical protein